MSSSFIVGQRVDRLEDRDVTGATVITVVLIDSTQEEAQIEIEYDEGGSGWWPASMLAPRIVK